MKLFLKKSGFRLSELRAIVNLIRAIESKTQRLLGEEIGVKVITFVGYVRNP